MNDKVKMIGEFRDGDNHALLVYADGTAVHVLLRSISGTIETRASEGFRGIASAYAKAYADRDRLRELLRRCRARVIHEDNCAYLGSVYGTKCGCGLAEIDAALEGDGE